jgi:glutamate:GABA antiporter
VEPLERKKTLGLWDLVLFTFCAIFGIEAIATSAAIGPSALSWWLICIVGYFLPFGLITAELGSTYPEQGGIYIWIKKALGGRWAARSTWYYWISLPLWLPAIYVAIVEIIAHVFFPGMGLWTKILIIIVLIWFAVGINLCPLWISKWVPNFGSLTRLLVTVGILAAAVLFFVRHGHFANEINLANIMPGFNGTIVFLPVLLYNLVGFELMSGASGEMKNPSRDVPKAVLLSAIMISSLYLLTTIAFWVVVPASKINVANGIFQVFDIAFRGLGMKGIINVLVGILVPATLFAGIVTWCLGDNRTVAEAAKDGELPEVLGRMTANSAPVGASIVSGIVSTAVIVIYGMIARNAADLFWQIISFSFVVGLLTYMMLFVSYVILRKKNSKIEGPYRVPGPDWFAVFLAVLDELFVVAAAVILLVQPGRPFLRNALPVIIGTVVVVVIGEIFVWRSMNKQKLFDQTSGASGCRAG